ncbi:MAG: hypothetical protein ACK42G_03470 [Candidatus Kapaibacteriota bacterium]
MKKIYVLLVFVFILGFVGNPKASGQIGCEVCQAPYLCTTIMLDLICAGRVEVVLCYRCYSPNSIYWQVLEIRYLDIPYSNLTPTCEDYVWDNIRYYVLNHLQELCGYVDCAFDKTTIEFTVPLCGEMEFGPIPTNPNNMWVRKKAHPSGCDLRCKETWEVCWDSNLGKFRCRLISSQIYGGGSCLGPYPLKNLVWPIEYTHYDCIQLWLSLNCPPNPQCPFN